MSGSNFSFYWHDYETFGANPMVDRPVQFAGIRTDAELNILGEPLMIFCKPADDYLPHPEACLITGITPQQAIREGVPEAKFIERIHQELALPGTCGVGYNSLRFDDEVTRYTLYRNFFDPYAREWQNGNSRWDVIDMLRLARALRPEGINWPEYENGRPSLRLEDLTAANGLAHEAAHDALSDVHATIAIARLVKQAQPKLFAYALKLRDKRVAAQMLDVARMKPVLHVSSKIPSERFNTALVAPLAVHPVNKNAVIVYDLSIDPTPLLELTAAQIAERLYTPSSELAEGEERIPLKLVHLNKSPMLAPANMINAEEAERLSISGDRCRTHLGMLRGADGLVAKVQQVFEQSSLEPLSDPDQMLYSGGFFGDSDKQAMTQIRKAAPELLGELEPMFQDGRLEEMLFRYRARNYPDTLSGDEQQRWSEFCRQRLLQPLPKTLGFEQFYQRLNELGSDPQLAPEKMHILQELAAYAESIYPV
ncbi:exodeoxyribonuclease I [Motiliproteus coralliicola]|uniref:Exodeoxyribonuclease I n=1 Tax=Motiliproteus coralliicola TaxID=2283196 RepID=A0A369WXB5_9GAMM|nr:exodeoxyribonuclease I [Motiliproteus coralliicola]RDE24155.1 exodeoxyribonuclease I [Motiliproteus coralliicola]